MEDLNMQPVTEETIKKAEARLQKYKQGKQMLDQRLISNEQWWKMRHWVHHGTERIRGDLFHSDLGQIKDRNRRTGRVLEPGEVERIGRH